MLHTYVDWPRSRDLKDWTDGLEEFELAEHLRNELSSAWEDSFIERSCHICGDISCFVRVDPLTPAQRALAVTAVQCPTCGLSISDEEPHLAEYHVGPLQADEVERFLHDIGE
jgi:hypothetical protein